jgi:hypothetical protein
MSMFLVPGAEIKVSPCRTCSECGGSGQVPSHGADVEVLCQSCDGFGRSSVSDRCESRSFVATAGQDTIDTSDGLSLASFLEKIQDEWDLRDEDIVCWELGEAEGSGPVVVALLRAGPAAQLDVLLMEN